MLPEIRMHNKTTKLLYELHNNPNCLMKLEEIHFFSWINMWNKSVYWTSFNGITYMLQTLSYFFFLIYMKVNIKWMQRFVIINKLWLNMCKEWSHRIYISNTIKPTAINNCRLFFNIVEKFLFILSIWL